jgi:putative tryptophan/tyrosine transport system substrate-binding protein
MKRREFITLLGGAAAWPLAAHAQQTALPVIGFIYGGSRGATVNLLAAFWRGLNETGYVEGQNAAIEYRWAEGQYERLPALAADLVRRQVGVIAALGGDPPVLAAKGATTTIPIVFEVSRDPVQMGLVASLNRPGGNMTGVNALVSELWAKGVGLLHELVPAATTIAFLVNPKNSNTEDIVRDAQAAANALGRRLQVLTASSDQEIQTAFATLVQQQAGGLAVGSDTFFYSRLHLIANLGARYSIPTLYGRREFPAVGGLMSYGTSLTDTWRQVGIYSGQVLKGVKPAELPVVQSVKFELIINLQTAKALGLEVPATLLARADEVIE